MWLCVLSSVALPISLFCSTGLCPFSLFPLCVCLSHPPPPETSSFPRINSPCVPTLPNPLFWSSLIVFHQDLFQSAGSNWGCDCVWLYCCGRDMSRNKTGAVSLLSSSGAVSLMSSLFFHPSPLLFFHQSLSLPLIRWVEHALPPVMLILAICPHDRSKNYNACCVWRALRSVTPPLCPGAWSFTGA